MAVRAEGRPRCRRHERHEASDSRRRARMNTSKLSVIGQSLPKIDAWAKVTGETKFADDMVLPRMAHAKLLQKPAPPRAHQAHRHGARGGAARRLRRHHGARPAAGQVRHPAGLPGRGSALRGQGPDGRRRRRRRRRGGRGDGRSGRAPDRGRVRAAQARSCPSRSRWRTRTCASTSTATAPTSTRPSRSSSATSRRRSRARTSSARTSSSSRATRTCRWSSTRPWRTGARTAS